MDNMRSGYFFVPPGFAEPVKPRAGESVQGCHRRLKRLARHYLTLGRAFRVERTGECVTWERVALGQQLKLAPWHRIEVGESAVVRRAASERDLKASKATARYLRSSGKGEFLVRLEDRVVIVTRTAPARSDAGNAK